MTSESIVLFIWNTAAITYANLGYIILYPRVIATIVWQRGVSLGIICTILVIVMVRIRFLAEYQQETL